MANPPLVAHVTEAVQGGIIRHLEWIVRALPPRGVRLHLILSLGRTPEYAARIEEFRKDGIGVSVIPMVRQPSPVRDWAAYRKLRECLRSINPDLVHTHSSKAGMLGRRAAYSLGVSAVHTPHVFAFEWGHAWHRKWFYTACERMAARWCSRLVLLSEAQRAAAENARVGTTDQYAVIPNGIDPDDLRVPAPDDRLAARKRFGLGAEAPVLGMAARFEPQKGMGDFLRAAKFVVDAKPEVRFLLAGEGSLKDECRQRADRDGLAENIFFCGAVEHMQSFYDALDGFVLASLWEGLPYVILETQATGLPVVATATRGAEAIILDGETGLLAPIGDSQSLANGMLRLLSEPDFAASVASAGQARVREAFPLDRWADGLVALYREVLEK